MVNYRRVKTGNPDDIVFLTIVTNKRDPWIARWNAYAFVRAKLGVLARGYGLKIRAWVLLPDHLHLLFRQGRADYSKVVTAFKRGIGAEFKARQLISAGDSLWQARFWEHTIKDDADLDKCISYIHCNPVKHGLSEFPRDWRYSSFQAFVKSGIVPADWTAVQVIEIHGAEYD